MNVRRYVECDYQMISDWMNDRGRSFVPPSQLPKTGWIIDDVACLFLMKTDCKVCILEHFVTNQDASEGDRLLACDLFFEAALGEAQRSGCEVMHGNTSIPKVIALGLRYGFVSTGEPNYFFTKKLTPSIVVGEVA